MQLVRVATICFLRKKIVLQQIHLIKAGPLNPHGHAQVSLMFLPIDMVQEVDRILNSNQIKILYFFF
jgi:hypothetical protein